MNDKYLLIESLLSEIKARSIEQRKYNSKPEQIKNRVARNKARRHAIKSGRVKKGDGKDIGHKNTLKSGGSTNDSNTRVQSVKSNRSEGGQIGDKAGKARGGRKSKVVKENVYTKADNKNHSAISAIIRNSQGKILMMDHVKHSMWTIPVGKVDPGDTPRFTLDKEINEELGIKVIEAEPVESFKNRYKRPTGTVLVTQYLFDVLKYSGTPRNMEPEKHRSIKWMAVDQIKRLPNLSDATKKMLIYLGE